MKATAQARGLTNSINLFIESFQIYNLYTSFFLNLDPQFKGGATNLFCKTLTNNLTSSSAKGEYKNQYKKQNHFLRSFHSIVHSPIS